MFEKLLFRASSAHKIMSNPKKGVIGLSEACKKHLRQIYVEHTTGRVKSISSKYFEKGTTGEKTSIKLYNKFSGRLGVKNTVRKNGKFTTGECDLLFPDKITDTKSMWDPYTLDEKFEEEPDDAYYWQGQCYMSEELFDRPKYTVAYCLIDTPEKIVEDEKRRLLWTLPTDDDYEEACIEMESSMQYGDIDYRLRVIEHNFERNESDIKALHERIPECREWLEKYHERRTKGKLLTDLK